MSTTEQAPDWFTRLRERELSPAESKQFVEWLAESPANLRDYLRTAETWGALQSPDIWPAESTEALLETVRQAKSATVFKLKADSEGVSAGGGEGTVSVPSRMRRQALVMAFAASVALAVLLIWPRLHPNVTTYKTARGEQRSFTLADGSVVRMNTLSTLTVGFIKERRSVSLLQGEAYFRVAPDKIRPFEVQTPFATVRAVGTEFNVYNHPRRTRVTVLEGKVRVASPTKAGIDLIQQQSADVDAHGQVAALKPRRATLNTQPETAWIQRRIVLDGERIDAAVAEFNRYNAKQIQVDDPILAAVRITGAFNADDPLALVKYLQEIRGVQIDETKGRLILR